MEHQAGIPAASLSDEDLLREMGQLHRTRHDAVRHGSDDALAVHEARTEEFEAEYRRRWPDREVDPARTREGRRGDDGAHHDASEAS
ncbi:MAG TPA: DUF6158 family protein [Candidatus Nanopelagicales bacterium]